jgi:hypothetical protein
MAEAMMLEKGAITVPPITSGVSLFFAASLTDLRLRGKVFFINAKH